MGLDPTQDAMVGNEGFGWAIGTLGGVDPTDGSWLMVAGLMVGFCFKKRVKNGKKMGKHWDTQKKVWKI